MAIIESDVLRLETTETGIYFAARNRQVAFATDTKKMIHKFQDGSIQKFIPEDQLVMYVGETGSPGAIGDQGYTGVQGETGLSLQGATGVRGETGLPGAGGGVGTQGATGAQGIQGIQGIQGNQGIQGDTGAQGNTGIAMDGYTGLGSGFVPYYNGTFFKDSPMYQSSEKIGIGTVVPDGILHLSKDTVTDSEAGFNIQVGSASGYTGTTFTRDWTHKPVLLADAGVLAVGAYLKVVDFGSSSDAHGFGQIIYQTPNGSSSCFAFFYFGKNPTCGASNPEVTLLYASSGFGTDESTAAFCMYGSGSALYFKNGLGIAPKFAYKIWTCDGLGDL